MEDCEIEAAGDDCLNLGAQRDNLSYMRTGEVEEGREDVGELDEGGGAFADRDGAGPTGDEGGVEAAVPVGPLVAGELGALFAGKEDEGVVGEFLILEQSEEVADLAVHVSDLGKVVGEALAGEGGVGEIGRELEFFGRMGVVG